MSSNRTGGRLDIGIERASCIVLGLLFSIFGSSSCTENRTEVVVVVDTDLAVPDEIDSIAVEATSPDGESRRAEKTIEESSSLPATVGLVHDEGALGPFEVRAVGLHASTEVIERRARFSFVSGQTLVLELHLVRACRDHPCPDDQTCVDGECRPIDVGSTEMRPRNGEPPRLPGTDADGDGDADADLDADADSDADTDGDSEVDSDADGDRDADADGDTDEDRDGGCPDHCECETTCSPSCTCATGCPCDLSCSDNCEVDCVGSGTVCSVDAEGISNLSRFVCEDGADCNVDFTGGSSMDAVARCSDDGTRCDVDCTDASNCVMQCVGRAECLLRCGGEIDLGNCRFAPCAGEEILCPGDVRACGRAWP